MRMRTGKRRRRAATVVEGAIVFGVFLLLVLGALDMGVGVYRSHIVCAAARQGARQATVHGMLSTNPWGPATIGPVTGNDGSPLAQAVQPWLVGLDPSTVTILAEWPDGGNQPEQRVRVTVSAPYQPVLTALFGNTPMTLKSGSTMPITH